METRLHPKPTETKNLVFRNFLRRTVRYVEYECHETVERSFLHAYLSLRCHWSFKVVLKNEKNLYDTYCTHSQDNNAPDNADDDPVCAHHLTNARHRTRRCKVGRLTSKARHIYDKKYNQANANNKLLLVLFEFRYFVDFFVVKYL